MGQGILEQGLLAGGVTLLLILPGVAGSPPGAVSHVAPDHRLHGTEKLIASGNATRNSERVEDKDVHGAECFGVIHPGFSRRPARP
jgi:hypothetical protein